MFTKVIAILLTIVMSFSALVTPAVAQAPSNQAIEIGPRLTPFAGCKLKSVRSIWFECSN